MPLVPSFLEHLVRYTEEDAHIQLLDDFLHDTGISPIASSG